MKRYFCLVVVLLVAAVLLMSCNFRMTGKPNDYFGENNVKPDDNDVEANIEEGDVVKVYGDYIIKANTSGLYVIHTDNGNMTPTACKPLKTEQVSDLIVYEDYLISVFTYKKDEEEFTKAEIFDLSTLTQSAYGFPVVKEFIYKGKMAYCKVYNGIFYLSVYTYNNQAEAVTYCDNGESVEIKNKTSYAENNNNLLIISKTNFEDMTTQSKAIFGYFMELCQFPGAICIVFADDGSRIVILSEDLRILGSVYDKGYHINNRFSITYNGQTLIVVSNEPQLGTNLSLYDNKFKLIGRISNIAPGERLTSVRYDRDYCYIVTFRKIDPVFKIDIRDPKNPVLLSELKLEGYSSYLHLINERGLAIGFQSSTAVFDQISFSLISNVNLFDISQDEVSLINSLKLPEDFGIFDSSNRQILVDRTRDRLILFALRFTETESNEQEQNGTTEESYLNVLVISYSEQGIQLLHYFDVKKLSNISEIYKNIMDFIKSITECRSIIIGDYLYVVTEDTISSYSIEEGYIKYCELMFQTVSVIYK